MASFSATAGVLMAVAMLTSSCTTIAASVEADGAAIIEASPNVVSPDEVAHNASFTTIPSSAAYIVRPRYRTLTVYDTPRAEGARHPNEQNHQSLMAADTNGTPLTLAAIGEPADGWVQVRLAERPNFSTGWVEIDDVEITWTTMHIVVDSASRTLTLFDGTEPVVWGAVTIGTARTPTPLGETYVSELLAPGDPDGLYGPYALGLALFSDEVTEYAGGDGQIGLHGTNSPELLGTRASLGCVRTHNDLISELAGRVPLGTPVSIV